jgi:hypothetical protein
VSAPTRAAPRLDQGPGRLRVGARQHQPLLRLPSYRDHVSGRGRSGSLRHHHDS